VYTPYPSETGIEMLLDDERIIFIVVPSQILASTITKSNRL